MFKNIHIENFKSIKKLDFKAKRVNLFIGEPNSGKSNILEALSLLNLEVNNLHDKIRFKDLSNLFYDNEITEKIVLNADNVRLEIITEMSNYVFNLTLEEEKDKTYKLTINNEGYLSGNKPIVEYANYYKYTTVLNFNNPGLTHLKPPFGDNLFEILRSNRKIRELVSEIFKEKGYRLSLRMNYNEIEMAKDMKDTLYLYPYITISDTLLRICFYIVAMMSNKNSVLLFEEPEVHTFPYYTKYLGEQIAIDKNNQYFIVTHNPYFLISILEKTPVKDVAVFITEMKDYQTVLKQVNEKKYSAFLEYDSDIFFNLNKFMKA